MVRLISVLMTLGLYCLLAWLFSSENRPFDTCLLYFLAGAMATANVELAFLIKTLQDAGVVKENDKTN